MRELTKLEQWVSDKVTADYLNAATDAYLEDLGRQLMRFDLNEWEELIHNAAVSTDSYETAEACILGNGLTVVNQQKRLFLVFLKERLAEVLDDVLEKMEEEVEASEAERRERLVRVEL